MGSTMNNSIGYNLEVPILKHVLSLRGVDNLIKGRRLEMKPVYAPPLSCTFFYTVLYIFTGETLR